MLENSEIIKFLASFSIIIVLIYSFYYYIKKSGFKFVPKAGKNIKVLESIYLSKNSSLQIVEVGDFIFLLSVDEKGISKIKEWQKKDFDNLNKDNKNG